MVQSTGPLNVGADFTQQQAETLAWWGPAMSFPLAMTVEVLRFAARRMSAQADHLAEMAHCKNLADAFDSQSAFFQSAAKQYSQEAEVLMKEIREAAPSTKAAA
jgi:hypothetical protein